MEVHFKELKDLLKSDLSLLMRGIVVTILLLKDDDPKLTLAKFKATVKIKDIREELVWLHENKYISWDGYKAAKEHIAKKETEPKVIEVITFMNELYSRRFDYNSSSTVSGLRSRLNEYSIEAIKGVVSNRWEVWKDDPVMRVHLNPQTIFRPSKFPKYLEDYLTTKRGAGIVSVQKLNLKQGDVLTSDLVADFIDTEVYSIRSYELKGGKRVGKALKKLVKGATLKAMLRSEDDNEKFGGNRNNEYEFLK